MVLAPGTAVRLIDRSPIDALAKRLQPDPFHTNSYCIPEIEVGHVGRVTDKPQENDLFEVQFPNCKIICSLAMVEVYRDPSARVAAELSPRRRVELLTEEFAASLVKTIVAEKTGAFGIDIIVEAFGTYAALHFDISVLEAMRNDFSTTCKPHVLESLHAHWRKLPQESRFAMEGEHHLFDKTGACYWIRERDAIERLNARLESIARILDDPTVTTSGLAARIRQMKERI